MSKQKESEGKEIYQETHVKRPICNRCKRPQKVCLCEALPDKLLQVSTTVYILQHPEERHRTLTTVPLLSACLPNDKCIVYNDVRYSQEKYPQLHKLLNCPKTLVLYPDENATNLREVVKEFGLSQKYNLVVPDGTWRQARKIFKRNDALQRARKVQLNENTKSHYVIRTQPTRNSLSTLEAVAVALSILEGRDDIAEVLRKPLQLLCDIQLQHGAVPHTSKEEKKEQEMLQQEQSRTEEKDEGHGINVLGQERDIKMQGCSDLTGQETQNLKEDETERAPKRSKLDE